MLSLFAEWVVELIHIITETVIQYGYAGAFVIGFLGAQYFPSWIVIPLLGSNLEPHFVGILAGLGGGIGQFTHYYVGAGGRRFLSKMSQANLEKWKRRVDRYGVILIFAFAVTPLSVDDIVWIPMGLIGFSKKKAFVAVTIGKIVLNMFYAYAGIYGFLLIEEIINLKLVMISSSVMTMFS